MKLRHRICLAAVVGFLTLSGGASADEPRELEWKALVPPGDIEKLASAQILALLRAAPHGSAEDTPVSMQSIQPGMYGTVGTLDGTAVRISGFIVPLEFVNGGSSSFLLVPYYGACIHAPPPPPNQTILVRSERAVSFGSLSEAYELEGVLHVSQNTSSLADSAYLLNLTSLKRRA